MDGESASAGHLAMLAASPQWRLATLAFVLIAITIVVIVLVAGHGSHRRINLANHCCAQRSCRVPALLPSAAALALGAPLAPQAMTTWLIFLLATLLAKNVMPCVRYPGQTIAGDAQRLDQRVHFVRENANAPWAEVHDFQSRDISVGNVWVIFCVEDEVLIEL